MKKTTNDRDLDDFIDLIDSRVLTEKEEEEARIALLEAREKSFKARPPELNKQLSLMQLRLQMEEFLENPEKSSYPKFSEFLRRYVNILYDKQKEFASDLGIKAITLSQILNQHRDPQQIFLQRLTVHSAKVFKDISYFKKDMWPRIFYQDKLLQFVSLQEEVMEEQAKYVSTKRTAKYKK